MTTASPLILTLHLDTASARYFNDLRQQYFPQALNFIPAHITLFHHLPGEEIKVIIATLEQVAGNHKPIDVQVKSLRFLGRGVAYSLESVSLSALHGGLARKWSPWLTPQDRQGFKPHITVQNKIGADEARRTLAILTAAFTPRTISGVGLDLWHYLGGPWEHCRRFLF